MTADQKKSILIGLIVSAVLAIAIFLGSRNLRNVDAALVAYTFASLFAAFGLAYRYTMWIQRPPTRLYWNRGWRMLVHPKRISLFLAHFAKRFVQVFLLNVFIFRRNASRGLTHMLIMWGCILASAITFPLAFGWLYFETLPGELSRYRIYVFGFPTIAFPIHSIAGELIFHGLVWASILVISGLILAFRRRLRDYGAAALQDWREDLLPLFLLFAVSATGILLWVSYTWMHGYGYSFLSLLHAVTVIFTLLWMPFGKFFHIFQRPAQLAVKFYRDEGAGGTPAICLRCGQPYASRLQIEDLIPIEDELGYRYQLNTGGEHYQHVCPACRRKMLALAQGVLWTADATHSSP
jgi:hypothetical protein